MINKVKITAIIYAFLWAVSLLITANYSALDMGSLFFFLFAGGAAIYLFKNNCFLSGIRSKSVYKVVEVLLAIYFTMALLGRSIFMQSARFDFSIFKAASFTILVIALYPITPGVLILFEKLSKKKRYEKNNSRDNMKIALTCCLLVFLIDFLLTLSYYPCTMTNDSISHWEQAVGTRALSDYSPIAFNLLLRWLFSITGFSTPFIYVVFQTVLLSLIVGDITLFLYRKGIDSKKLIVGSCIFALTPSTYMLLLYLSKNPLTGITCLGTVITLLQVMIEPEYYLKRTLWYIKSVVLISALYLVRENNVVVIIPLIGFVVWFLHAHKKSGKRILIVAGGVFFLIVLMTQVVYKTVEYEHVVKNHETVRPLIAPIGSAIQQDLPLPDDILETAEKILPSDEWVKRYDPYNSDNVTWGDPKPQYNGISLKRAFSEYFKMLAIYPDVVIRDRLDGMNLIWDIRAGNLSRCPMGLGGDVSFKDVSLGDGIIGFTMTKVKRFATSLYDISAEDKMFDTFIWKNGIYLYLLFVTALFLFRKKRACLLWAVLPSTFILLTYVLVIAWQMYYYIWFFSLSVELLIIVSVAECRCYAEDCERIDMHPNISR